MKQVQLKSNMDCTNLRTREGQKVRKVKSIPSAYFPYEVYLVGDDFTRSYTSEGQYFRGLESAKDIFGLEEGDQGYISGLEELQSPEIKEGHWVKSKPSRRGFISIFRFVGTPTDRQKEIYTVLKQEELDALGLTNKEDG